jgi:hypothetical protein
MTVTVERILSLLPKNEDGKYTHGAKTDFARSIGYKDGHVFPAWINGTSDSYKGKLAEISLKYGVSVEWLKGETDDPTPRESDEAAARQLDRLIENMSREELSALIVRASELLRDK